MSPHIITPSLHSIHSGSEQRKWLSDITKAPMSAAPSLICALCVRYKATSERAAGLRCWSCTFDHLHMTLWRPARTSWTCGALHWSSKRKDRHSLKLYFSQCKHEIVSEQRPMLCWFCPFKISRTTALALNTHQPHWKKRNIYYNLVLSFPLFFEWVCLWSFVRALLCGLRAFLPFNGGKWVTSLISANEVVSLPSGMLIAQDP